MPKDSYASGPSSNPSSRSYSGGGGGGVSSGKTTGGGGVGVSTGKTIYGNTAFGPAGGMATGYATRTGGLSGLGPSIGMFSNFRNLDGSAMVPAAGNAGAMGTGAQQALGQLQRQFAPQAPRVGGLLDGAQVVPTAAPVNIPIPVKRPLSALEQFQPWWNDPVQVKYQNPYTFRPNPAIYTPGPKPGQYGPQIPDNPAVYTPGPKPGQYGPQRPSATPQGWNDFSNSVANGLRSMRPMGQR